MAQSYQPFMTLEQAFWQCKQFYGSCKCYSTRQHNLADGRTMKGSGESGGVDGVGRSGSNGEATEVGRKVEQAWEEARFSGSEACQILTSITGWIHLHKSTWTWASNIPGANQVGPWQHLRLALGERNKCSLSSKRPQLAKSLLWDFSRCHVGATALLRRVLGKVGL